MPKEKTKKLTPMMQQWHSIRSQLSEDTLLLFRLGDFYEVFHQDAEKGARLLGITLTHRNGIPMAGIPYHAADTYLQKLLDQNIKIAICEQMEAASPGKLVERKLTRIITPGTRLAENQIEANRNHFLLAIEFQKKNTHIHIHVAWLDLTTGAFYIATDSRIENLMPLLESLSPKEILLPEKASQKWQDSQTACSNAYQYIQHHYPISPIQDYLFDPTIGAQTVKDTLSVLNLNGFGIDIEHPALGPAGALLNYAKETLCATPENITKIEEYKAAENLLIDPATLQNLEIFKSASNQREGSLLEALDATVTAPGSRLLERWMASPLLSLEILKNRQACVGEFIQSPGLLSELQQSLKAIRDLERILGRLQNKIQNPRELGGIRDSLDKLPHIQATLAEFPETPIEALGQSVCSFNDLSSLLSKALNHELPSKVDEGGVIREGFDAELDRLKKLAFSSKTWLTEFEQQEQTKTGIKNLRIRYNGAFGYFIEITKSHLDRVPESYTRRQTMKNAERFTTPELKEKEQEILQAEEQSITRETECFQQIISEILNYSDELLLTAQALAEIDVLLGFAQNARNWDYCKPTLEDSDTLSITQGRHPVVEQMLKEAPLGLAGSHAFVPNDCQLACDGTVHPQIALITGPNMAGKSTYIRQVALIVFMAQIGSWVPAKACNIGIVDRIFSRVGASDQLAQGNSTFMVEMNETANILNNHTERSLIILDEIGRGTSTYDGLSIAWAVIEHLHKQSIPGPRTLFATHYHELTKLADSLPKLANFSVAVKEWDDEIIFVRQIIPGPADRSYGIQVARLAGLPSSVIDRAKAILDHLEKTPQKTLRKKSPSKSDGSPQIDLFQ